MAANVDLFPISTVSGGENTPLPNMAGYSREAVHEPVTVGRKGTVVTTEANVNLSPVNGTDASSTKVFGLQVASTEWGTWSNWSTCAPSCGHRGVTSRRQLRICTYTPIKHEDFKCYESRHQIKNCMIDECQGQSKPNMFTFTLQLTG